MKLLKIFLGNLILLVFIGLLFYLYFYREPIVKELGQINTNSVTSGVIAEDNKEAVASAKKQPKTRLEEARLAYWSQDYDKALELYKALLSKDSKNSDYHGEIGNIYFNQHKLKEASEHYYQAAQLLIADNQLYRARQLVGVLYSTNRRYAEDIRNRLRQNQFN